MQHRPKPSVTASRLRPGLGTFIAIEAEADSLEISHAAIRAAFAAVALVERLMHPTRDGSDLARLRDCPAGTPLLVHAWTWQVLGLCKRLNRLSHGAFDPCVPEASGRLSDLQLVPPGSILPHVRLQLDLGGIAKGFAVDRALDALRSSGCRGGLVNAGGDLAVFGDRCHEILSRHATHFLPLATLRDAALATSDAHNPFRPAQHQGYYDGIDGRRISAGRATVIAPSAALADGLTKCVLAGNSSASASLLEACAARRLE